MQEIEGGSKNYEHNNYGYMFLKVKFCERTECFTFIHLMFKTDVAVKLDRCYNKSNYARNFR